MDRCASDLALTCYLAYSWFAHTVLRAWPTAHKFFCGCTYLELERVESWRGSSCHCGWNELHWVVITCRRKEEGGSWTMRTGWDNERPNGRPDKCQHSSCGPACTQPRHSAQTSALTKESAGQIGVGFRQERLFFSHILLFYISFLSLPTLAQPFLIWFDIVHKFVFLRHCSHVSAASINRWYIMFCKKLDMAAGLSYYCSTFHYVFYNVIWHNETCERERGARANFNRLRQEKVFIYQQLERHFNHRIKFIQ